MNSILEQGYESERKEKDNKIQIISSSFSSATENNEAGTTTNTISTIKIPIKNAKDLEFKIELKKIVQKLFNNNLDQTEKTYPIFLKYCLETLKISSIISFSYLDPVHDLSIEKLDGLGIPHPCSQKINHFFPYFLYLQSLIHAKTNFTTKLPTPLTEIKIKRSPQPLTREEYNKSRRKVPKLCERCNKMCKDAKCMKFNEKFNIWLPKGISYQTQKKKWMVQAYENKRTVFLARFATLDEAKVFLNEYNAAKQKKEDDGSQKQHEENKGENFLVNSKHVQGISKEEDKMEAQEHIKANKSIELVNFYEAKEEDDTYTKENDEFDRQESSHEKEENMVYEKAQEGNKIEFEEQEKDIYKSIGGTLIENLK